MKNEEEKNASDSTDPVTVDMKEILENLLMFLRNEKISDQYNTDFTKNKLNEVIKYVEKMLHDKKYEK